MDNIPNDKECLMCTSETGLLYVRWIGASNLTFAVCELCHKALFYAYNGDQETIYWECYKYYIERTKTKSKGVGSNKKTELEDKTRRNKNPITYEEIADLSWELHFNNADKIYNYLTKNK